MTFSNREPERGYSIRHSVDLSSANYTVVVVVVFSFRWYDTSAYVVRRGEAAVSLTAPSSSSESAARVPREELDQNQNMLHLMMCQVDFGNEDLGSDAGSSISSAQLKQRDL